MVSLDKLSYVAFWFDGLKNEDDIRRACATLRDIGYKGVDFKDLCFDTDVYPLHQMLRFAVSAAEKEGVVIPSTIRLRDHCSLDSWKKNATETCEFIKMSADAGIKKVNTVVGSTPARVNGIANEQPAWDALKGSLEMIAKTAEENDVTVVLETVMGQLAHDYFTAREMFRLVDSKNLCLTMDPSHYQLYGNDIPYTIRQWGNKIQHVHLKDTMGVIHAPFGTPLLGEGQIDWPGFFTALDDIGYDGWYSVEFESWNLATMISKEEAAAMSYRCAEVLINKILGK